MTLYKGAIEAGGTKFNCAIMSEQREIIAQTRIPTTSPEETIGKVIAFYHENADRNLKVSSVGLACFGPLDLNLNSDQYGSITQTPKPNWSNVPIRNMLMNSLSVPVFIETDVNAAALAEYKWGNAQTAEVCVYVTIGTGLGGGLVIDGRPIHGLVHPEMGHMLVNIPDNTHGCCPFHDNCAEGLASGTAMRHIWKQTAEDFDENHPAWELESEVLAKFCHNLMMILSPNKIILGGGVMGQSLLIEMVRTKLEKSLAGYISFPKGVKISDVIVETGLGELSGLYGAFALTTQED